jgi:MSHA pilin protein MshC
MMKKRQIVKDRLGKSRGFTLIEVIAVLVIIAIVSVVVISRQMATGATKLQVEADTLKGNLRYAQSLAMNNISQANYSSPSKWGIQLSGSSYTLIKDVSGTQTSPFLLPNESSATHTFPSGITASVTTGTNPILFDDWGSPGTTSTSVSIGSQSITITATTGFIP